MIAFMRGAFLQSVSDAQCCLHEVNTIDKPALLLGGEFRSTVPNAVEGRRDPLNDVKRIDRQKCERFAEFHRCQVRRSDDLMSFKQTSQAVVKAELSRESNLLGTGKGFEPDSARAASQ